MIFSAGILLSFVWKVGKTTVLERQKGSIKGETVGERRNVISMVLSKRWHKEVAV